MGVICIPFATLDKSFRLEDADDPVCEPEHVEVLWSRGSVERTPFFVQR